MTDRLHGCYKDVSASVEAVAICTWCIFMLLAVAGWVMIVEWIRNLVGGE